MSSARQPSRRPHRLATSAPSFARRSRSGEISLEEVLDSDDPIANRMKVSALIESLTGYGKAKAAKIMDELGISATRRVKGLGARQREQLIEALSK
jgi:ribosomal protein S13